MKSACGTRLQDAWKRVLDVWKSVGLKSESWRAPAPADRNRASMLLHKFLAFCMSHVALDSKAAALPKTQFRSRRCTIGPENGSA